MSHELLRLTSKICNSPLLVSETYLDKVMQILENRNEGLTELAVYDKLKPESRRVDYFPDMKLGIINIHGGLTDVPYYGMCGEQGVSHQSIREEFSQLVESGAKVVVLDQDSPGGIGHMAFESAEYIRNLADDNNVKIISYVSSSSHSASYVYSAVAHEVISNPSAEVGSIGVRVQLRNTSGALKKLGIEDVYVTAGDGKVPFDSEGKFTQEFINDIQESVLDMYDQFTDHVAMWRGKDKKEIIALGAKSYSSKKSLANGLIDKVMTLEEFKNYLEEITLGEEMSNPVTNLFKSKKKDTAMSNENTGAVDLQELASALETVKVEFEAYKEATSSQLSHKNSELETALAQLKVIAEEKAALKAANRKASLVAAVGTDKAEKLSKSLSSLNDEDFEEAVAVFKSTHSSKELEFEEVGGEGSEVIDEEALNKEALSASERTQAALDAAIEAQLNKKYNKGAK